MSLREFKTDISLVYQQVYSRLVAIHITFSRNFPRSAASCRYSFDVESFLKIIRTSNLESFLKVFFNCHLFSFCRQGCQLFNFSAANYGDFLNLLIYIGCVMESNRRHGDKQTDSQGDKESKWRASLDSQCSKMKDSQNDKQNICP